MGIVEQLDAPRRPYARPEPISSDHNLEGFSCGKPPLDDWLTTHARDNEGKASRTYVVVAKSGIDAGRVVAYYTLANGSVPRTEVPKKFRHGLPNPVPIMLLGRLAVDAAHSGKALGPSLLREAMQRTLQAAQIAGLRALVLHAIDDDAVGFYAKYGFQIFPHGTRTMFLPVETLAAAIS